MPNLGKQVRLDLRKPLVKLRQSWSILGFGHELMKFTDLTHNYNKHVHLDIDKPLVKFVRS